MIKLTKKLLKYSFIRFLFIGGINTLFGYSVFSLFIFLKVHYVLAALFANILGVLFNFQTIGRLVFKHFKYQLLWKFVFVYGFIYLLNITGLKLLKTITPNHYVSGFILIFPLALISYFLNKMLVFKKGEQV